MAKKKGRGCKAVLETGECPVAGSGRPGQLRRGGGWKPNLITIAWTGNVCSDPPMLSISVRPERYSYDIIKTTKEFVVNVPSLRQARAVDWCGVVSGRDEDKFAAAGLTPSPALKIGCPIVAGMSPQHRMPGARIPVAGLAHALCRGGDRRTGLFGADRRRRAAPAGEGRITGLRPRPVFRSGALHRSFRFFRPKTQKRSPTLRAYPQYTRSVSCLAARCGWWGRARMP